MKSAPLITQCKCGVRVSHDAGCDGVPIQPSRECGCGAWTGKKLPADFSEQRCGCTCHWDKSLSPDDEARFLNWIADRLVNVYKESEYVDFVQKLRRLAREGK